MAKFDEALNRLEKTFSYKGNPPSNESEYNAMKHNINNAPTWLEIQTAIDNLPNKEDKKASGKQKLKNLGLDDDEIKALIGV